MLDPVNGIAIVVIVQLSALIARWMTLRAGVVVALARIDRLACRLHPCATMGLSPLPWNRD